MKQFLTECWWWVQDSWPGIILGAIIIGGVVTVVFVERHHETVVMPEGYRAWVKQTGNEKDLTYGEWRALMRASEGKMNQKQ